MLELKGAGHVLGRQFSVATDEPWFRGFLAVMEGNNEIDIDGDDRRVDYLGTEDSFTFSWGFQKTFAGLHAGMRRCDQGDVNLLSIYRFHDAQPIRFNRALHWHINWTQEKAFTENPEWQTALQEGGCWVDFATVHYWYQDSPGGYRHEPLRPIEDRQKMLLRSSCKEPEFGDLLKTLAPDPELTNSFSSDEDLERVRIVGCYERTHPFRIDTPEARGGHPGNPNPGRQGILAVHPASRRTPAVVVRKVSIPMTGKTPILQIALSGDPYEIPGISDFRAQAGMFHDGKTTWFPKEEIFAGDVADEANWRTLEYDLSQFKGADRRSRAHDFSGRVAESLVERGRKPSSMNSVCICADHIVRRSTRKRAVMQVSTYLSFLVLLMLVAGATPGIAGRTDEPDSTIRDLERDFRTVPMDAKRITGPLFWLHGDESPELLNEYVSKVAEGGNGCFTAESRPHNDWLGPGWYRDLEVCLEAAKRENLEMWIFDEKWWPSGEVAGLVPERYASKQLTASKTTVTGSNRVSVEKLGGKRFVAAIAGNETQNGEIDPTSLIDLSESITGDIINWDAPPGSWSIMQFAWEPNLVRGRYLVDGASRDAVDWYIQSVYQPHYDHFKEDFGTHIRGFFYDEPETHGDWGTEVRAVLEERGIDWKQAYVAWKFKLAGETQIAANYQYRDALAEAWGRTLYGGITKWCNERDVMSIGHFLEHRNAYRHPQLCAGNIFQLQKYSDIGGIDAVFSQFAWGRREANDPPCWQTPKLGSSISHAYGKTNDLAMVEIYGARGQDLTYPEMKWWLDHMQVSGINFIIPHAFNPRSPFDLDCPPYFYNNGYEPRWPLYRVLADYSSRLSLMLTGGRHVCPVALLYLGQSTHVGKHNLPHQMSEALQDALYDCDWIPYGVFENEMTVGDGQLILRDESYRVLIVPAAEVIPYETLARAKAFYDGGGIVVGYGLLPTKSATFGRSSSDISVLRESIWGSDPQPENAACQTNRRGGRSYLLPDEPTPDQLQQMLAGDAGVHPTLEVLEGETGNWLHVLHRVKAGRDVFFITNQNHVGDARRFVFRIEANGIPECWNPLDGNAYSLPFIRSGDHLELSLTMQPNESVLLVFQENDRGLPPLRRSEVNTAMAVRHVIPVVRDVADRLPPTPTIPEAFQDYTTILRDCHWVWYPEGNPAQSAPAGTRYFRRNINIPDDRQVVEATFTGTADNSFSLAVNGNEIGSSLPEGESWRDVRQYDITTAMQPGPNQFAISVVNATDRPSPAGVIGVVSISFDTGKPMTIRLDNNWKASNTHEPGWQSADFDDSSWTAATEIASYGDGPWGRVGRGRITLSPVEADPYLGHASIPDDYQFAHSVVYLEMDGLGPEEAARVTVNGKDAGGFISKPLRVNITSFVRHGRNTIWIEPFAPENARLVICDK
jgi:hypothetical protein